MRTWIRAVGIATEQKLKDEYEAFKILIAGDLRDVKMTERHVWHWFWDFY